MKHRWVLSVAAAALLLFTTTTAAVAKDDDVARPRVKAEQKQKAQVKAATTTKKTAAKKKAAKPALKSAAKAAQPMAAAKPSTDVEQRITKAGDHRFTIQHGGLPRTYRVHVPKHYDASEPAPLLVALHGGGVDRPADDGLDGLARESEAHGFIAVFPDAYAPAAKGRKASWNAGNCCGDAREQKVDDVGFIQQVVANVFRQVSIDRGRIYAAGMSDGGMMAYRLACDAPGLFKGVASVGGADSTIACTPDKPISVVHFHAANDPHVPFKSAPATTAKWAALNGCSAKPRRILEKDGAYCEVHSYCRGLAEVQLCVTDTGGHSWPGAKARPGAPAPSQAIMASRVMWEFLISR